MRRRIPSLLVMMLVVAALPALGQGREFSRTVDFESGGRLRMKTFKGSITVRAWDREQAEVKARIEPAEDTSEDYARRSVEATQVEVRGGGRFLTIEADYEDVPCEESWWGMGCSKKLPYVHFEIRVPRQTDFRLEDHKSRIDLAGLEGDFELDTHKGVVELANLKGEMELNTHKGEVDLAGFAGRLSLNTHKGNVELEDIEGEVELGTHRGHIRLVGLRGGVEAATHRGTITIEADELSADSELSTYRGTIELTLPREQRLTLRASLNRHAEFESDFELSTRIVGRERLEAKINGGGPPRLYIESEKGKIRLREGAAR
ncbi:MAG: DUF4097 family beta strand repeat-containing protein [Terriglobia bacterium]